MSPDLFYVTRIELIAYDKPYNEPVAHNVLTNGDKQVNFYLKVAVTGAGEERVAAIEGGLGQRNGKPMAARYWDYLETVASRLMGSQLTSEIVHSGSVPSAARQWVEATDSLIDNAGIHRQASVGQNTVCGYWYLQTVRKGVRSVSTTRGSSRKLPPILR